MKSKYIGSERSPCHPLSQHRTLRPNSRVFSGELRNPRARDLKTGRSVPHARYSVPDLAHRVRRQIGWPPALRPSLVAACAILVPGIA
eukprot:887353-Rhodomonas_salina.2